MKVEEIVEIQSLFASEGKWSGENSQTKQILRDERFCYMNTKNKAIVCILISAFGFSIMNLCVKLSGDLPSIEKSFFRNLVAAIIAFILLYRSKAGFPSVRKRICRHWFCALYLEPLVFSVTFYVIEPYGAVGCFHVEQVITFLYTDLFLHLPEGKVITLSVYCHCDRFYRQFVYHQAILWSDSHISGALRLHRRCVCRRCVHLCAVSWY